MIAWILILQIHVEGKHADVFGEEEAAWAASRDADAAGEKFREVFGASPLRAAIVLTKDGKPAKDAKADVKYAKNGAKWVWRWEAKRGREPDATMAHELGHLWLIFWADGERPKAAPYGSSLPDWLDEGVASLLEGADYGKGKASPLADLFTWEHPDSRGTGEKAKDRGLFYAQSASVVRYLDKRGALGHVAKTLRSGKKFEDALGCHGLPKTLEEFEAAWAKQ